MKSSCSSPAILVALASGVLAFSPSVRASDFAFINASGGDFLNPFNWSPSSVPGVADNANFTIGVPGVTWAASRTNANAFFNPVNGAVQQFIGTNFWLLTNSYVVGQNAGSTSAVLHFSGELRVTNSAGNARMVIGQAGKGTYLLQGVGSVMADRLFVTNNSPALTNSVLLLNAGTLTTLRGSVITQALDFTIGAVSNATATWNMLGGTNTFRLVGDTLVGGPAGARGVVNVTGASTVWSNSSDLSIGDSGWSCLLVVSNGGKVISRIGRVGANSGSTNNQVLVTGPGSLWTNRLTVQVGLNGSGNSMVISNGGVVADADGVLGGNGSSSNNVAWVTGAGSLWTNSEDFSVGANGPANTLVVSNGGTVIARNTFELGSASTATSNRLVVSAGNIVVTNATRTGTLNVRRGQLDFNGGSILVDRLFVTNNAAGALTNSIFNFNHGTLTTLNGSVITQANSFAIGDFVGQTATWNLLGGTNTLVSGGTLLGAGSITARGVAVVAGPSTVWSNSGALFVGNAGSSCLLVVSNGARVVNLSATIGLNRTNNQAWIAGSGSSWLVNGNLFIGQFGSRNALVISNGGFVLNQTAFLGASSSATNNLAWVTGADSVWTSSSLNVGDDGSGNTLVVSNAGTVISPFLTVGANATSSNNTLAVTGGNLFVTNAGQTATLDVRRGQAELDGGSITANRLFLANGASSVFNLPRGTLNVGDSTVNNTQTFFVGDGAGNGNGNGASTATLNLAGNGTHSFANGLTIRNHASLTGNGTISGVLTVQSGGTFSPGVSVGKLLLSNSPLLQGATLMEVSKNGSTLTNDQLQVIGPLTYGGTLTVTKIGPTALSVGDQFPLFSASSYAGSFSSVTLPTLSGGQMWTNQLPVNGSIQVVVFSPPKFGNIALSGTNILISGSGGSPGATYYVLSATNVALPLTNWTPLLTNQFGWLGNFTFTNGISPVVPQRFYVLQVP